MIATYAGAVFGGSVSLETGDLSGGNKGLDNIKVPHLSFQKLCTLINPLTHVGLTMFQLPDTGQVVAGSQGPWLRCDAHC